MMIRPYPSLKWVASCLMICLHTWLPAQPIGNPNTSLMNKAWLTVDSLESQGLYRQALDMVKDIYDDALTGNANGDIVKALLFHAKYMNELSDGQQTESIQFLEAETDKLPFPARAVLHSVLGEMYFAYLRNNYYTLSSRTTTADYLPNDISTWSPSQLEQASLRHYLTSVENPGIKTIPISEIDLVTTPANATDQLRPSVYDFLAHRAIDHFADARSFLNAPVYRFQINDAAAFATAEQFIAMVLPDRDTGAFHFQALTLFQELLRFRSGDTRLAAFLDVDLKRLQFVYQHAVLANKDALYTEALQQVIRSFPKEPVSADYSYALARWYQQMGQQYDRQTGSEEQRGALAKAVAICDQAVKLHPGSRGAIRCLTLKSSLSQKDLGLCSEEVLVPDKPILLSLNYQNINMAHIRVVPLRRSDRERFVRDDAMKTLDWLLSKKSVQDVVVAVVNPGDYRPHRTEVALKGLPAGFYALLVADNPAFKRKEHALGFTTVQIADLAVLSRTNPEGSHELVVMRRTSGEPLPAVKASFFNRTYDWSSRTQRSTPLGESSSDANGFIRVPFPLARDVAIVLEKDGQFLFYEDYLYPNRFNLTKEVTRATHLFLDRAIYRPGQTIYFKGLLVSSDEQALPSSLAGQAVTITLKDVNHRVIQQQTFTSNEFGTFSGSFQAPLDGLMGMMSLESSIGSAIKSFRVEEYKRPKFDVNFMPLDKEYALGDQILVQGQARAYAGYGIDGAQVQYRVVREAYFPWAYWWRFVGFGQTDAMELARGTTTTDEEGLFKVSFDAVPDFSIARERNPAYRYVVYADVTDLNGETHSGTKSIHLAWHAVLLNMNIPDELDLAKLPEITFSSLNLDNQAVAVKGNIHIHSLESPRPGLVDRLWETPDLPLIPRNTFIRLFPNLPYLSEHKPEEMPLGQKLATIPFDTEIAQTLAYDFSQLPVGYYKITMEALGIRTDYFVRLYRHQENAYPASPPLWIHQAQERYQPGDTLKLVLVATDGPVYVLTDKERAATRMQESAWHKIDSSFEWTHVITEQDRGGFTLMINAVKHNRLINHVYYIQVPWDNKRLQVTYTSFRDKLLPGAKEEWRIKIADHQGRPVRAEVLAAMYDASLDVFATNPWYLELYPNYMSTQHQWSAHLFSYHTAAVFASAWNKFPKLDVVHDYRMLRYFELNYMRNHLTGMPKMMRRDVVSDEVMMSSMPQPPPDAAMAETAAAPRVGQASGPSIPPQNIPQPPRINLKETVFFMPDIMTDEDGHLVLRFTMNEALTRWNFSGLALTRELSSAIFLSEIVTQKPLMVQPNPPRFVREGDQLTFPAKVINLSATPLRVLARLDLFDAITMQAADSLLGNTQQVIELDIPAGKAMPLSWKIQIPDKGIQAITHRVTVVSGEYSDGEENSLPVLSNRMLVTESLPMSVRGGKTKSFTLNSLSLDSSATRIHHKLQLEFTANPAWYAVQALPYLMEYPYDCSEQLFNKLFANTLASAVINNHPNIKAVFDSWSGTDALQSNLLKNESLKSALITETPWVLDAASETEQRKRIALLFDLQGMAREQSAAINRLAERQMPSGGFSWFSGGNESWYITQYIVEGIGQLSKLQALQIKPGSPLHILTFKAIGFMDVELVRAYEDIERLVKAGKTDWKDNQLSSIVIHYLYARSFFPERPTDATTLKASQYFSDQAAAHWRSFGLYEQAMIGLAMHRNQRSDIAGAILRSLTDRAIVSDEMGMYWPYQRGFWWNQLPIETHTLMMSLFAEAANNQQAVEELKLWLLKNKQTTNWKTTKATAAAVYALLSYGDNWLSAEPALHITMDKQATQIRDAQQQAQAGSGYFQTSWSGQEINQAMATVKVRNAGKVLAWGGLYWQYFEDMDKITAFAESPLRMQKRLFKEVLTDTGPELISIDQQTALSPGDKIIVRIEIRTDRDMEYVHLKDMRASGLEPLQTISAYQWQGGLGYYESTSDVAVNFFIDYLRKGTYVFEYPLRVVHQGNFSNGISTIQSMYAPEFSSHSAGIRLRVDEK